MTGTTLRSEPRRRSRGRRRSAWSPKRLSNLRAWYDAELGQPKYSGVGAYVQLDGASTDNIFTLDSVATSFSNDIEVIMRVYVNDWTTAANQTLCGKYLTTGNQRSWRFYVTTTGTIGLTASVNGTAVTSIIVTPTTPFVDATWYWLRLRLDLTNGANSVGTVEYAADTGDNTVVPTVWTANGTYTGTTIAGIFDSTAVTEIGGFSNGTLERLSGRVGRFILRSGFDGTTVSDFNASDCYGDGYWHSGGYRWNLGLPKIYDRSGNNVAPATFGSGSNQPKWLPWEGRSQVYQPGSPNLISCPSSTALNVVGDLEAVVHAEPDSWYTDGTLFSKWAGWAIGLSSAKNLRLYVYVGGAFYVTDFAMPALFDAGGAYWIRMRRRASDGRVQMFYANDAPEEPSTWTQVGSDAFDAPGNVDAGVAPVAMGSNGDGSGGVPGRFFRGIVRAGFDGTTVADFVAASCGQSGYTDTLGNIWTVNRSTSGRKTVVQSPVAVDNASSALLGTDDVIIGPAAAVPSAPSEWSIVWVGRRHESADDWAMLMSTGNNATSTSEGAAIYDFGPGSDQLSAGAHDGSGVNSFNSFPQDITRGTQTVATLTGDASDLTFQVNGDPQVTVPAPGGVVNMTTLLIGRATDGGYSDQQWRAAVIVDRILTDTEHGLLTAYYRGGL